MGPVGQLRHQASSWEAGALGPVLGVGPVLRSPPGVQPCRPGAAPASSKPLRLLAQGQLGHGGHREGACLTILAPCPPPVPALGTTLTQPEEPYLAPAPPRPGCPVTAVGSPPLWPGPTPTTAPHPGRPLPSAVTLHTFLITHAAVEGVVASLGMGSTWSPAADVGT